MGPEYDGIVPHVSRHKSASTLRMLSIIGWIIGPSLLLSVHFYSRLPECCFMYLWIIIVSHHTNGIYAQAQYITSQKKVTFWARNFLTDYYREIILLLQVGQGVTEMKTTGSPKLLPDNIAISNNQSEWKTIIS